MHNAVYFACVLINLRPNGCPSEISPTPVEALFNQQVDLPQIHHALENDKTRFPRGIAGFIVSMA